MARPEKVAAVELLREKFSKMSSAVLVDFVGMNVEEVETLRKTFRAKGIDYKVVKNTLVKKALADEPWASKLVPALKGMTGIAWSYEEPSAAARLLKDLVKDTQKPAIKAGLLEGSILDAKGVENQLATLPNKDEARAMLLATLNAPAQRFVMLLQAPARDLVGVLSAKERAGSAG